MKRLEEKCQLLTLIEAVANESQIISSQEITKAYEDFALLCAQKSDRSPIEQLRSLNLIRIDLCDFKEKLSGYEAKKKCDRGLYYHESHCACECRVRIV